MTNENTVGKEPKKEPSEQALLTEYQACQQDNSSTSISYWTLAGIFFGISSALLAALIYGVLANRDLFQILLSETTSSNALNQRIVLGVTLVLGTGIIFVLCFLWGWLKRVGFLQQINYERMREIELELGMWKSWRVHALDQWPIKRYDKLSDKEIWDKLQKELKGNLNTKYSEQLEGREYILVKLFKRFHPKGCWPRLRNKVGYIRPSSKLHVKGIFGTLIALWMIPIGLAAFRFIMTFILN